MIRIATPRPLSSIAVLAALELVVAAFFFDLFTGRTIPVFRDLLVFTIPYKEFLAGRVRQGVLPLWNPWLTLGTPFLAALQTGVFYPPSILLLLPMPIGFGLFVCLHYFLALAGMWFFLRSRGCRPGGAAVAGLTFTLGGYLVSMMNVTNHLQAGVWAPWVLLAWDRYVDQRSIRRWSVFVIAVGTQILAGAPESLLMTLVLVAASHLHRCGRDLGRAVATTPWLAAGVIFAICLTAIQVLPTAEYIGESARNTSLPYDEVMTWSLQPVSILQLLYPHGSALGPGDRPGDLCPMFESTQPWIISLYFGLAPLCLAVVGAALARGRLLWVSVIGVSIVLALGKHLPVLPLLLRVAPEIFGRFRFPEKFWFLVHFAVAVLAARGTDLILERDHRALRIAWITAAALGAVAVTTVVIRHAAPQTYLSSILVLSGGFHGADTLARLAESVDFRAWRALLLLGAFAAVLWFGNRGLLSRAGEVVVLAALVAFDLGATHYDLNLGAPWSELVARPGFVDFAELRRDRMRIFHYQTDSAAFPGEPPISVRGLVNLSRLDWKTDSARSLFEQAWQASLFNLPMLEDVGTLGGGDGITRAAENVLSDALSLPDRAQAVRLLGIFSVRYLIGTTPLDLPGLRRVPEPHDVPFFVYRMESALPQAYLATRWKSASSDLEVVNHLISPDFVPGVDAVVSEPLARPRSDCAAAARSPGSVRDAGQTDDRQRFVVESPCEALLVVNDSFFPGWTVTLDGQPARILRTNLLVRGIPVPPGKHEIVLAYGPASFRNGALLSILSLGILVTLVVRPARR